MIVIPPELEKKIAILAAQRSLDPSSLIDSLVARELNQPPAPAASQDDEVDPKALSRAVAAIINRTPEQISAAQEMALREFKSERELPAGATNIFDVIPVIRGQETDEQVSKALEELS